MTKLKIKTESLPQRCEICHKIDEFDPETGICGRCCDLPTEKFIEPVERLNLLQRAFMRADFLAALARIRMRSFFDRRFQNSSLMRFALYAFITLSMGTIIGLGMTVLLTISTMPNMPVKSVQKTNRVLTDKDYGFADKENDDAQSVRRNADGPLVEYQMDIKEIFSSEPSDENRTSDKNVARRASDDARK